jgi:DNA invertase Pin-like site-specific DNA recombinase
LRPKDIVIVTKLDRLARSLSDLVTIMAALKEMGVGFKSLGESIDLTTPAGRMQMGMFAIVAEFERELIVQRTMDGLAHARSRGRIGGRRPALNDLQRVELIERVERGDLSIPKVGEIYGVSRATVNRIMKQHRETSA